MNGSYTWRAFASELAELVQTTAPRVALAGVVVLVMVAGVLLRIWRYVPW
ncbi:MAG TPA: hypothetical protein VML91_26970 [Burkholderiales bacterium]|nr:hypothetical protein [Burkholderiales bacterium]